MTEATHRNVSFRSPLLGDVNDFLRDEGVGCSHTCSALVAIAASLATYKEEGVPLAPEVFLCNSIDDVTRFLPGHEVQQLGSGPMEDATVKRALKECAPLATDGWHMFIERVESSSQFQYGVFACIDLPFALTAREAIMDDAHENAPVAICARRLAENCVELQGIRGSSRCIYFSDVPQESPSPSSAICQLVSAITRDVNDDAKKSTERYCLRFLSNIFQQSHGTLIAVVSTRKRTLPRKLRDCVTLDSPVCLSERVRRVQEDGDAESLSFLNSAGAIVKGMLSSDGILVIRTDAAILAYRAFLQLSQSAAGSAPIGGSRRRTFEELVRLVQRRELVGAFYLSQDGATAYHGETT